MRVSAAVGLLVLGVLAAAAAQCAATGSMGSVWHSDDSGARSAGGQPSPDAYTMALCRRFADEKAWSSVFETARTMLGLGLHSEARRCVRLLTKARPNMTGAHTLLGDIAFDELDARAAVRAYDTVLQLSNRTQCRVRANKALSHVQLDEPVEAAAAARGIIELCANESVPLAHAHNVLAEVARIPLVQVAKSSERDAQVASYRGRVRALLVETSQFPEHAVAWKALGDLLHAAFEYTLAHQAYNACARADPAFGECHRALSVTAVETFWLSARRRAELHHDLTDRELPDAVARTIVELDSTIATPRIPNVVHFIKADYDPNVFHFVHYLALRSAYERLRPAAVLFHCAVEPSTEHWTKAAQYATRVAISVPQRLNGKVLHYPAHRADVLRVSVLLRYGGIYMDWDVISVRSFQPWLSHEAVIGQEQVNYDVGLAVLLSEANGHFMRHWLRDMKVKFETQCWSCHSVQALPRLSREACEHVHVTMPRRMYFPLWRVEDLAWLHEAQHYDAKRATLAEQFDGVFSVHLWESNGNQKYLANLTPARLRSERTNFAVLARDLLAPDY